MLDPDADPAPAASDDADLPMVWERPVPAAAPVDHLPEVRPAYRAHLRAMGRVAVPLMVVLVPLMQILCVGLVWVLTRSDLLIRTLAPLMGMLGAIALVAGLANWLALVGNRRLEGTLRQALRERFGREGGEFVGVSTPDSAPVMREQMEGQSDVGLLFEDRDALVVEGMAARQRVPYADVRSVSLAPNFQFIQFGAKWCVVRYRVRDGVAEREAVLRFVSRRHRTVRRNVQETRALCERLRIATAVA